MEKDLAVVTAEHAFLRQDAGTDLGENESGIEDEIFSGWAVRILEEPENRAYVKVETHYGYQGYLNKSEFRKISRTELEERQEKTKFFRIGIPEADLLALPKVQGLPRELLLKNSLVELLQEEVETGWSLVRSASGKEGYIHTQNLKRREEDDAYLLETEDKTSGYFCQKAVKKLQEKTEEEIREGLAESAKRFLGTQYRWGGKSSQGIDCSGLAFMSFLDNGLLIWRDAGIVEGYPIKSISSEALKKGDLIFFPGHVAMYLGEGRYIHSTGFYKPPYVTINSLNEEDEDYREDLAQKITGYGSVFA